MKDEKLRKMGVEVIGDAPWGTHFCLFYQTKEDLVDILVPYFKAGLENNEFCMWVTSEPLNVDDAERALQRVVKDLDDYIEKGQIEILDYSQWYTRSGRFDADEVLQGWVEKEAQAVKRGFDGLRLTGNTFWLEERDWEAFTNYEAEVDRVIGQHRMLALCTYSLDRCRAVEVIDVVSNHQFALIKQEGEWEIIESAERKRAEEEDRTILRTAMDGFWLANVQGRFLDVNDAYCRLIGYSRDELLTMGIQDVEALETPEEVARRIQRIMETGSDRFETRHRCKDGRVVDVEVSVNYMKDAERLFVFLRDITERKRAEEALRESERRLREAQAMGRIGDWKFDIDNQKITWSDQVCKLYERDSGLGAPTPEEEATYYSPGQARILREYARRSIENGEEFEYDLEVKLPSGRTGYFSACMHPIKDESGRVVELFGTVQDITERKRAEEALRRHLERAEALREIDRAVTSTLDLPTVLDIVLQELERVIPYHSACIFLLSDGTARLTAGRGFPDLERVLQVSFPVQEDALTREVLQEKRPLVLADAQADERFLARGGTEYVRSWIGVPLIARGKAVGFLTVDHREPGVYGEESAEMVQTFASQAAIAIENARLYQESQRRAEEMAALREVNLATLSALERDQVFEIMLDQLGTVIAHDTAAIKIITPDGRDKMIAGRGPVIHDQPMWNGFDVKDNKLVQEMKVTGRPVVVNDTHTDERYQRVGDWAAFRSWAGAPLFVRGDMIGYLAVEKASPGFYDGATAQILGDFAHAAAIALENARLYEDIQRELAERKRAQEELHQSYVQLQRALEGTVGVLVSVVEMRDPYTAGHQRRVTQLACAIANEMGLPEEQIEGIRMAGLIHDVGKISVPAEILSKPGQLTDLEFGLIKMHPQVGHDVLNGTVEFPWPVAQIVLQHHERMDGSGYPQGLSGEEIILEARIMGVADVVEAMASHRPYRSAQGIDKALEEISQNRGTLYDPEVVDACLKLFIEKGFKLE